MEPLARWKIIDVQGLFEETGDKRDISTLRKNLQRLEKHRVIKSFRDPFCRKKYIYLSEQGSKLIGTVDSVLTVSDENRHHDAKLSDIARILRHKSYINEIVLEHQLAIKKDYFERGRSRPDAVIDGFISGKRATLVLELELSRKSKERIKEKIDQFMAQSRWGYLLYFFGCQSLYTSYKEIILAQFGRDTFKRIILFWNTGLFGANFNIDDSRGSFEGAEISFGDLFS